MKKSQQGATVVVCVLGLLVLAVGAGVLVNELRKERQARERLEHEAVQLKAEMEKLKGTGYRSFIIDADYIELIDSADLPEGLVR